MGWLRLITVLGLYGTAVSGFAAELQCDLDRGVCSIANRRLTIGDKVAIINEDREILAEGVVEKIKGLDRIITLKKVNGTIPEGARVARFRSGENDLEGETDLQNFEKPAHFSAGGSAGLGSIFVGDTAIGFSLNGAARFHRWRHFHLIAGAGYSHVEGEVARMERVVGIRRKTLSVNALGVFGGVLALLFPKAKITPVAGIDVGTAWVFGSVGDNADDLENEDYETGFKNGIALSAGGRLGAQMRFGSYLIDVSGAFQILHKASGAHLMASIYKELW